MRSVILKVRIIILRYSKAPLLFVLTLMVLSCTQFSQETSVVEADRILFPCSGAIQQYGQRTLLQSGKSDDWYSSIDGFLGNGVSLSVSLSAGIHTISIRNKDVMQDRISITVQKALDASEYCLEIQGADPRITLPAGAYLPLYVTGSGLTTKLTMGVGVEPSTQMCQGTTKVGRFLILDVALWSRNQTGWKKIESGRSRSVSGATEVDVRTFHFVDLKSSGSGKGPEIFAHRVWSSQKVDIWLDDNGTMEPQNIQVFGSILETRLIPHHLSVWGKWNDIDSNNKLSILITPVFNKVRTAIGLFNPADFYAYNNDPASSDYNPNSNQMDIIYTACPDYSRTDASFSPESIRATIAHEMQHLTSFSVDCEQQKETNLAVPALEEVFLEEGLAHLAENLAGYGISGGNIAFVARYLQAPYSTSLGPDVEAGFGDSVERRGGMVLLLSWLYEKYENASPQGGEVFIQSIYHSRKRGWPRLEEVTGLSQRQLLRSFGAFLSKDTDYPVRMDPVTSEPVTIDPYAGNVITLGKIFSLNGPARIPFAKETAIPPFSVIFGEPLSLAFESSVTVARKDSSCISALYLEKEK
jgi:hypothetical protein